MWSNKYEKVWNSYYFHEVIYVSFFYEKTLKIWLAIIINDRNEFSRLAYTDSHIEFIYKMHYNEKWIPLFPLF